MAARAARRGQHRRGSDRPSAGVERTAVRAAISNAAVCSVEETESRAGVRNSVNLTAHEQWMRNEREERERIIARSVTHQLKYNLHLQRLQWAATDVSIIVGAVLTVSEPLGGGHSAGQLLGGLGSLAGGLASAMWQLSAGRRKS